MAGDAIVLDSGALSAFAERDKALRFALEKELSSGTVVRVPTVVIAESATGDPRRDAKLDRTLKALIVVGLDEATARAAAALRHALRVRRSGTIDAIVVATADRVPGTRLMTTDASDLRPLAAVNGRTAVVPV